MRISRIYTEQTLYPDQEVTLEQDASRHLVQVLRLRAGTELALFNGDGYNYHARLEAASKNGARIKILSRSNPEPEGALNIHLCLAISKGERMDFAIQKSVEMGVTEITPIFSKHSVVNLDGDRLQKRQQHWRKVMLSACEQSGRRRIPVLNDAVALAQWINTPHTGICLVLNPEAQTSIVSLDNPLEKITLLIGPEGGLGADEISTAKANGFTGICLGPRILRTETAPVAAIAAMQTLWGDFR